MNKIKRGKPTQDDKNEFLDFFLELLDFKNQDVDWYFTKAQARVIEKLGMKIPQDLKMSFDGVYHHTLSLHVDNEE